MTLDDALQPLLARLRAGYATSPLPGFLGWWGGRLRACLPERWQAALTDHVETLLIDRDGQGLDVYYASRPGQPPAVQIPASQSPEEQRLAIKEARASLRDPRVRVRLCLPRKHVLARSLTLPAAAERNLVQVLGFEMDRQTPFKLDQVYLDQHISGRDHDKKTIRVDLAVVPRTVMDAELKRLEPLDLPLDGIDAWADQAGGGRLGFNFLPRERRVKRPNKRLWLNVGLGAAALLLVLVAMNLWVANRQQALDEMRAEVTALQKQAKEVTMLRRGLTESIQGASFLMRKKSQSPMRVELLRAVTHKLGDETFLQRLTIDNKENLSLQGLSEHAASVLAKVSAIPYLTDASFQGVIQPDARTGKERFTILATIVAAKPGGENKTIDGSQAADGNQATDGKQADQPTRGDQEASDAQAAAAG